MRKMHHSIMAGIAQHLAKACLTGLITAIVFHTAIVLAQTEGKAPGPEARDTGQQVDADTLRSLLEPHGWRVEREPDGSVLLIPGAATAPLPPVPVAIEEGAGQQLEREEAMTLQWDGIVLPPIREGGITIPVDTWSKAHDLARAWVAASRQEDLQVGKIRRINRRYVVSVVSNKSPYNLRYQLIIRIADGHVFPVS